ncbi:MAG: TRAP transporter substrate-binding protein DctP, partial [Nitrospinota bacterium]
VRKGIVQAMAPSAGILASHFPPIQVLYTPYVFKSEEVAWKVMDGWFGKELAEALRQKTGLRILAWNENGGFRNFVSARTVLTGPESLKGMKIRTEKVPASMEIARALGANPTPIAWKEVYTSMQTGVVDGMENSVNTFLKSKLEEVSKSMILDGHVYSCIAFMINDKFYQSLPADLQRVIDRAALIANYVNRGLSRNAESLGIQYMRKRGMVVTEPTPEQMKVFRQATKERVRSAIEKKIGKEWVDKLLKAIAEAEKELGLM